MHYKPHKYKHLKGKCQVIFAEISGEVIKSQAKHIGYPNRVKLLKSKKT